MRYNRSSPPEAKVMKSELYKKMYLHLFNAVTDAINEPNHIKRIEMVKQAQIDTEEMYISYCENTHLKEDT